MDENMKKIISIIISLLFTTTCFAYPRPNPFPPFRIADNLYYVGSDDLTSYLVVTPEGNILINSNFEADVPMIKQSIEKLGFKYEDTKILLISHAHNDHAEGSQLIKQQTHAKYMVMDADVSSVESGGKTDFEYGRDESMHFPASTVDRVLHDGDQVKLGDAVLTAHLTPGHTKGCTTWAMNVYDNGKLQQVVIAGSLNINTGYNLINDAAYPTMAQDFKSSFAKYKSLKGDIFLGAHAGYFDLKGKYARLKTSDSNPFIDPEGFKKHTAEKETQFYSKLKNQEQVISLVNSAKEYINIHGKEKALIEFNQKPVIFSNSSNQINFKDETEKAKSGGGWISATLQINPKNSKFECKETYVLPMPGDYFISSSYFYPPSGENCY
jgi:metallo-beta-lactamase class B